MVAGNSHSQLTYRWTVGSTLPTLKGNRRDDTCIYTNKTFNRICLIINNIDFDLVKISKAISPSRNRTGNKISDKVKNCLFMHIYNNWSHYVHKLKYYISIHFWNVVEVQMYYLFTVVRTFINKCQPLKEQATWENFVH